MSDYLKVEGNTGLVRDIATNAILNTDSGAYERYLAQKNAAKMRRDEISKQADEINNLKNEIGEIKQMLIALLNK